MLVSARRLGVQEEGVVRSQRVRPWRLGAGLLRPFLMVMTPIRHVRSSTPPGRPMVAYGRPSGQTDTTGDVVAARASVTRRDSELKGFSEPYDVMPLIPKPALLR